MLKSSKVAESKLVCVAEQPNGRLIRNMPGIKRLDVIICNNLALLDVELNWLKDNGFISKEKILTV